MKTTELFRKHEKLINMKIHEYTAKFNRDSNEVRSEALDIFLRVVEHYNPDLGKFSTYLYHGLHAIQRTATEEVRAESLFDNIDTLDTDAMVIHGDWKCSSSSIDDWELIDSANKYLSADAHTVLDGIYDGTFEAGKLNNSYLGRRRIVAYTRDNWGWSRAYAIKTLAEVENWYHTEVACV